tara:strand:- start:606 stop:845 length:240 start_codon:yes stop_codon:yes gene_type:complete
MQKIREDQLKKVVKQQNELSTILGQIGTLESQKHSLLHKIADVNQKVEEYKAELEEEYGVISINLETGEYTEIKEEEQE